MPNKKRRYAGRWFLGLICLILMIGLVGDVLTQPAAIVEPSLQFKGTSTTGQTLALSWPSYGEASIGAVGFGVLDNHGNQTAMPTASLAKVITALAVLKQHPLRLHEQGPTITLTDQDVAIYNDYVSMQGSVVAVSAGEQLSEYQALQALLLPSANNMADTLARWAFGSVDAYKTYANNYVQQLGLSSVKITDPSGYDSTTVASAHDMTVLGQLAMLNPVFADIVGQASTVIPVAGTITNYNSVLGQNGNIGIKTGNNDQDLGAILFAYKVPVGNSTVTIVGTVMGGPSLQTALSDSNQLARSAMPYFHQQTVVKAGQVVGTYHSGGGTVSAVASQSLQTITWDGTSYISSGALQTLNKTTLAGSTVGTIGIVNLANHSSTAIPVTLQGKLVCNNRWHALLDRLHI